ncbi:DUF2939 domain-containing protein [Sphingomonas sp. BK069]|uniref:DUF2939 domain-containing protein n=1 Tax=Sphingomonas sp. BK069 TaxID=2586979 RepID=UPI00161EF741|nr:DUF2939 domain-containing protein [Sphingomonas sp. BK069]MBB3347358.1 hypothetical protein [Sphingomonas sp. BK069]
MARKWVVAAIAMVALFVGAYFGSPYWAARQLYAAARSGDVDRMEAAVDFQAVRESLKGQLTVALTEKFDEDQSDNPFKGIGTLLMPTIVQRAVDAFVTPDGIASIVAVGQLDKPKAGEKEKPKLDLAYDYDWRSLDRFGITIHAKDVPAERAPMIVLERRGLFTWKMIRLQVPKDMIKNG